MHTNTKQNSKQAYLTPLWIEYEKGKTLYQCRCGTIKLIKKYCVERGIIVSCGCKKRQFLIGMCKAKRKYKEEDTPIVDRWRNIMNRCYKEKDKAYANYGGRGIKVCERWKDVNNFVYDMRPFRKGMSIDRIDNNGNYEPSNCRWATPEQQLNNTRKNRFIVIGGKKKTLAQWSKDYGLKRMVLSGRIKLGWQEKDLLTPVGSVKYHC